MRKPGDLRTALELAVPEFKRNPDALKIYVTEGSAAVRYSLENLGYQYTFTLTVLVENYTAPPDTVFFPVLYWIRQNQPDKLLNFDDGDEAVKFEVDFIDATTVDIAIDIVLTESVDVMKNDEGTVYQMTHREEPAIIGLDTPQASLPDGVVLLVTPYGEYLLNEQGQLLTKPAD